MFVQPEASVMLQEAISFFHHMRNVCLAVDLLRTKLSNVTCTINATFHGRVVTNALVHVLLRKGDYEPNEEVKVSS